MSMDTSEAAGTYRCPVCGRIFATPGDLSLHMEESHPYATANNAGGTASPETLGAGL